MQNQDNSTVVKVATWIVVGCILAVIVAGTVKFVMWLVG